MKDEIARLRKIVDKDSKSPLFLPLAEEYRKQGQLEEATAVLQTGLLNQPHYTAARVLLGKIFFERSMMQEAQEELERVLDTVPDNIAARRKLAEIYSNQGKEDLVREQEKVIADLTPPRSVRRGEPNKESVEVSLEDTGDGGTPPSEEGHSGGTAGEGSGAEGSTGEDDPAGHPEAVVEIATESMADVYISQNLYDQAMEVLEKLRQNSPDNKSVQQKIEDLRMLMKITARDIETSG